MRGSDAPAGKVASDILGNSVLRYPASCIHVIVAMTRAHSRQAVWCLLPLQLPVDHRQHRLQGAAILFHDLAPPLADTMTFVGIS